MNTRVKLNLRGFDRLRKSPKVTRDLERRGRQIAAAAGPGHEVETRVGRTRSRTTVRTATAAARRRESRSANLTGAIDAGRR